ncbi:MAG: hypothetical protein PHV82_18700 [Victivallaceae bacterium]|nr:hypothetical protein [Victivallaceae bacterium]
MTNQTTISGQSAASVSVRDCPCESVSSPKTMYTVEQITNWRLQAAYARLEDRKILYKYTDEQLAEIFNGIGSDGFPEWLRDLLSGLHPSLMPVALIHDVQWYERGLITEPVPEPLDKENFHKSNAMFDMNATKMAKFNYGWYDPRRYSVEFDGWKFKKCCDMPLGFYWWKSPNPA